MSSNNASTGNEIQEQQFYQYIIFNNVLDAVNTLSLMGAFLVVSVVCISSMFKCKAAKRLSFRLSMWIAIADSVFCILSYLRIDLESPLQCNIINSVGYFSNLLYVFLSCAMAFNLKTVFVNQQHNKNFTEKFYVISCVLIALAIVLPYFVVSVSLRNCGLYSLLDYPYNVFVFWLILSFWEASGIIFCFVSIMRVVFKLIRYQEDISYTSNNNINNDCESQAVKQITNNIQSRVEQVVRRIIFYPLIPIITQTPYIIMANKSLVNDGIRSLVEQYAYYVPSYMAGFLNAIVFLFDPALPEIYSDFKLFMVRKYVLKHQAERGLIRSHASGFEKFKFTTNKMMARIVEFLFCKKPKNNEKNKDKTLNNNTIQRLSYYQYDITLPGDINLFDNEKIKADLNNQEDSWRFFGTQTKDINLNSNPNESNSTRVGNLDKSKHLSLEPPLNKLDLKEALSLEVKDVTPITTVSCTTSKPRRATIKLVNSKRYHDTPPFSSKRSSEMLEAAKRNSHMSRRSSNIIELTHDEMTMLL